MYSFGCSIGVPPCAMSLLLWLAHELATAVLWLVKRAGCVSVCTAVFGPVCSIPPTLMCSGASATWQLIEPQLPRVGGGPHVVGRVDEGVSPPISLAGPLVATRWCTPAVFLTMRVFFKHDYRQCKMAGPCAAQHTALDCWAAMQTRGWCDWLHVCSPYAAHQPVLVPLCCKAG